MYIVEQGLCRTRLGLSLRRGCVESILTDENDNYDTVITRREWDIERGGLRDDSKILLGLH
jgi:hypothetical protein